MEFFISSFLFSLILNLCVIFLAKKVGFFIDSEESNKPQRFHTLPTPRAGGIGIFAPFFFALILLFFHHSSPFVLGLLVGGSVIFLSGIVEDFNASLSPKLRLLLQCIGAGLFVWLSQCYLSDLGFGISLPSYIGIPFSIFAIVGIINAINIIDGFNGLASGVVLLALGCIYVILPSSSVSLIILVLIASILGFFVLNFPWGKIFLGDGGAYFLGFVLAGILIYVTQNPHGGGGRNLPMVWDRPTHLSLLGSDFLHLSSQNHSFFGGQFSLSSNALLQNQTQCTYISFDSASFSSLYDSFFSIPQLFDVAHRSKSSVYHHLSDSIRKAQEPIISPWFGIALLIYPFWEVIFSIYRKKFIRRISPMQPDKLHFHMLIHKRLARSNPKTSLLILTYIAPFMLASTFLRSNEGLLIMLSFAFVASYCLIYFHLICFSFKKFKT